MGSNMSSLGAGIIVEYGQSFQWSIIIISSSTGNITIVASIGHTYVGNTVLTTNASFRFLTMYTALNTAITYRIRN